MTAVEHYLGIAPARLNKPMAIRPNVQTFPGRTWDANPAD
jgi:hypothetical protein